MEYRPIEVKLIRGKDLKDVNVFSTMDVYVVGSVSGDPRSMQQTAVDKDGGINPTWNHVMRFNVDDSAARLNRLGLFFQIMSNRTLGDKEVGRVYVPLKELFDDVGIIEEHPNEEKIVVYQVQTSTGRFKGQLEFSYKFGEMFTYTFDQNLEASVLPIDQHGANNDMVFQTNLKTNESYSMSADSKLDDEPVMAYPPVPRSGSTGTDPRLSVEGNAPYNYGAPPQNYPHPGTSTVDRSAPYGYGAPPQNYPYEGYGHGHGHGHGYGYNAYGYGGYPGHQPPPLPPTPNAHMGYDYGYPGGYGYPGQASTGFVQQPVKQHKKKGSKFGLGGAAGLGAGLLGGLLVGEMVEDVAEAAVYDDVYDF